MISDGDLFFQMMLAAILGFALMGMFGALVYG